MAKEPKSYKYLKIGVAWDGEYGISGSIEIEPASQLATPATGKYGAQVRFYLFKNEKKEAGSKSPDYNIMVKNPDFVGVTRQEPQKQDDLPF